MKLFFLCLFCLLFLLVPTKILALPSDIQQNCGDNQVSTAIGCISTNDPSGMVNSIVKIGVGLGGGIALLLILYGTFIITTSSGIPDKLNAGKDIIMSAISGLLLIVLSIVILNLVGINILGLPGLE